MQVFCAKLSVLRNWWKRFKETLFQTRALSRTCDRKTGLQSFLRLLFYNLCFLLFFLSLGPAFVFCPNFVTHLTVLFFGCFFLSQLLFLFPGALSPPSPSPFFLYGLRAFSSTKTGPKSGEITYFEATSKLGNSRFNSLVLLGIPGVTC